MDEERLSVYLRSLEEDLPPLFLEMEQYAAAHHVPIVRSETAAFLETVTAALRPERVLEIGTAIGYSALRICRMLPEKSGIVSIERNEQRAAEAECYIRRAGEQNRIEIIRRDAADVLPRLDGPFPMVFMDAAKGQYPSMLGEVLRLMPAGGVLITDNIFQNGTVLESRFAVSRRDRTIHARMREYLFALKHTDGLVTSLLPVGDGVALTVKTGEG